MLPYVKKKLYKKYNIKYANKFNILRTAATPKNSVVANNIANRLTKYKRVGDWIYSAPTTQFGRNAQNFAEGYIPGVRSFNDFRRNMRSNLIQYGRNRVYNKWQPNSTPESQYQTMISRYKQDMMADIARYISENRNDPNIADKINRQIFLANKRLSNLRDRYVEIENIRNAFLLNVPEAQREYIRRIPIYLMREGNGASGRYRRTRLHGTPEIELENNTFDEVNASTLFHELTHALRATEQATPKNKILFSNGGNYKRAVPKDRTINFNGRMYTPSELALVEEARANMQPRYYASQFKDLDPYRYQRINDYMRQAAESTNTYKQRILGTPYSNYQKFDMDTINNETINQVVTDGEAYNILKQVLINNNVPLVTRAPKISNPDYINYKTVLNNILIKSPRFSDFIWMASNENRLQKELNKRWLIQRKFKNLARKSKGQGIGEVLIPPLSLDPKNTDYKQWKNQYDRYKQFVNATNAPNYDFDYTFHPGISFL